MNGAGYGSGMSVFNDALALRMTMDDLTYASGSALSAATSGGTHPKLWGFVQWGVVVAYEGHKHLANAHSLDLELGWDPEFAAAARHSSKFFVDRWLSLDGVIGRFEQLLASNHAAYFPPNRRRRAFDFLRHDLSIMIANDEVILTNVSGYFMMGTPPTTIADLEAIGAQGHRLTMGIGEATAAFTGETLDAIRQHGNSDLPAVSWWDATSSKALASAFGGELPPPLAIAVLTVQSALQIARRWAHASCCPACVRAARKHRFIVLYQALRSLELLRVSGRGLGRVGAAHVEEALRQHKDVDLLSAPFRRLRNGWLHLGTTDLATELTADATSTDLVRGYADMDLDAFDAVVDRALDDVARALNVWILQPYARGRTLLDHLHSPD